MTQQALRELGALLAAIEEVRIRRNADEHPNRISYAEAEVTRCAYRSESALKALLGEQREGQGDGHASDCATHNMPAYPNGPCNCKPSLRALQDAADAAVTRIERDADVQSGLTPRGRGIVEGYIIEAFQPLYSALPLAESVDVEGAAMGICSALRIPIGSTPATNGNMEVIAAIIRRHMQQGKPASGQDDSQDPPPK